MSNSDQTPQTQQPAGQQPAAPQSPNGHTPAPVPPGPDMYDPRLLVDVIKSGSPDTGERRLFHRGTR